MPAPAPAPASAMAAATSTSSAIPGRMGRPGKCPSKSGPSAGMAIAAFTLGEVRTALAPGGALVISECVRPFPGQPVYVEFVFNLLEAFRESRLDPAWRTNGGFLTPEQWTAGLLATGFRDVRIGPDIAVIRDVYPSFVVAAVVAVKA